MINRSEPETGLAHFLKMEPILQGAIIGVVTGFSTILSMSHHLGPFIAGFILFLVTCNRAKFSLDSRLKFVFATLISYFFAEYSVSAFHIDIHKDLIICVFMALSGFILAPLFCPRRKKSRT